MVLFGSESLTAAPDWVYLDATGLSIGGVHRAEKEQDTGSCLQSTGVGQLSQVGIANESDQVT